MDRYDRNNKEQRLRELELSQRGAKMARYAEIIGLCAMELSRDRADDSVASVLEKVIMVLSNALTESTVEFSRAREAAKKTNKP